MTQDKTSDGRSTFNELLLGGVILLIVVAVALGVGLFILPEEHLPLPELQPFARVAAEKDFPIGAVRILNWGDAVILVVRQGETEYAGLEGTSPSDGCILDWDEASRRVASPCTYVVYDLRGNVVTGLTTTPLRRYQVYVRDGVVYVKG